MFVKKIIGFIGPICSGKDTAGDYVSNLLNIKHLQISSPLIEEAKEMKIPLTRKDITKFGTALAKVKGEDYLARILLEKIEKIGVISGMRQLKQIHYLRDNSDLLLISVDCPVEIRFKRAKDRNKIVEAIKLQDFIKDELEENSGENIQRVFECMKLADYKIKNDSNLESLHEQINNILRHNDLI